MNTDEHRYKLTFASGSIPPGAVSATPIQETAAFSYPGPTFTISANATSSGIAWAMDTTAGDLIAYDASDITSPIYTSNMVASDSFSLGVKFAVPTVANGMVYLGNKAGTLVAYGLRSSYLTSNAAFFGAPTNVSVSLPSLGDTHISWTSQSSLATEFRIDRSTDGTNWTTLAYVSNSDRSYDDTNAAANVQYAYRVVAISGASTTLVSPPPPPSTGSIAGEVFNDVNGNAALDSSEAGLLGWTAYIDANNDGKLDNGEQQTLTDTNGNYGFQNIPAGTWIVRAIGPAGWSQTTPKNNLGQHITVTVGKTSSEVLFGEKLIPTTGSISGTVFDDASGNLKKDSSEVGLSGCTVYIDANNDGKLDNGERQTPTDTNGNYTFQNVSAGTWIVRAIGPAGWSQTTPTNNYGQHITVAVGKTSSGVLFGEKLIPTMGSVSGTVFNDANSNGKKDSSEAGLSGWTVYIDANNDGKLDDGELQTLTDKNGNYTLANIAAGNWIVRVNRPSGWSQTTPKNNLGQHLTVTAGKTTSSVSFGEKKS